MDLTLLNRIAKSNANTNCRNENRDFDLVNPEYLKDFAQQSNGYKTAACEVLKKINN